MNSANNTSKTALNAVCPILRPIFLYNPLTKLLPLLVPGSNVLPLHTRAVLATVNVPDPFIVRLVFKVCPPETVLCQCALFCVLAD